MMVIYEALGIYKVKLPLPFRLNHVNCYAVKGSLGWWLIDAGLSREDTVEGWMQFVKEHSIKPTDIKGIYLTHFHPNHYGCSGWLQNFSGAPVYIGEIDAELIKHYWKSENSFDALDTLFRENGMLNDIVKETMGSVNDIIRFTSPQAELKTLKAGQMVSIGDLDYQVILTQGHSDGHICYYK